MTTTPRKIIPIYTSRGDVEAFLVYPYLYNLVGDWIGFVTQKREVYSIDGEYVGWVSDDPRILRKLGEGYNRSRLKPPPAPPRFTAPASCPLAPLMPELGFSVVDVLYEYPEMLPTKDIGELRPDQE